MKTGSKTHFRFASLSRLVLLSIALFAGSITAQTPLPPDIENTPRPKAESRLTADERELARDYVDLLESLHLTVSDFTGYLSELQLDELYSLTDQLRMIEEILVTSRITNDPNALSDKLKLISDKALAIEKKLGHSAQERKAHKLTRQLAQELELISDQLTNDLAIRLSKVQTKARITAAVQDSLSVRLEEYHRDMSALDAELAHIEAAHKEYEKAAKAYEDAVAAGHAAVDPVAPVAPVTPVPPVPTVPTPPSVIILDKPGNLSSTNKQVIAFSKEGVGSVTKEFYDSTKVSSAKLPIIITNPIGDLIVTGWKRNVVQVQSTIRFSVPTKKVAEEITNDAKLTIVPSTDGIHVTMNVPRFTDSRVTLSQHKMIVYVPSTNPVELSAQFATVQAIDINGGLEITASNSRVDVSGGSGGAEIRNSFGQVSLVNVTGKLEIVNSHAPVSIMGGNGPMHIATSFANVELTKSRGDATIEATGHVMVTDHIGNVNATNQNGSIMISNVQGNVETSNTFGQTELRMISGSATVENNNTSLSLENIRGLVDVQNRFGSVSGQTLQGPFSIHNESGSVMLLLGRDFNGNSNINSNFGSVQVIMPQESNGNLLVRSVGGQIQTAIPADVTTKGEAKLATIAVGSGNKKLTIDGNGSTIIVSAKR